MRKPTVEELIEQLEAMPVDLREREIGSIDIEEMTEEDIEEGPEFIADEDGRVSIVWD